MKCICTELIELATVKYKKFKQDKRTHYDCRDGLPSCDVLSLAVGADGRVWAGTQKGAAYFDGERFVSTGLFDSPVQAAFADLSGNVWLASGSCVCGTVRWRMCWLKATTYTMVLNCGVGEDS